MQSQRIRIHLKAYDYKLIDQSALEIVDTAKRTAPWFVVLFLFLRASSASTSFVRRTSTRRAAISLRSARISVSWTSSTRPIRRLML